MSSFSLHRLRDNPRPFVVAFFVLFFLAGIVAFDDYGVSWDEPNQYNVGEAAFGYVFGGKPWPIVAAERYYGTSFELPLAMLTHGVGLTEDRSILLLRHFLTFCTFFGGVVALYLLARRLLQSSWMGLLGAVLLVLSPRIFADAFYNSKDLPNLAFFTIAMYTLTRFLDQNSAKWMVIHACATAIVISTRLTGGIIPAMTGLLLLLQVVRDRHEGVPMVLRRILLFAMYLLLTAIGTVAVWPFLWEHPVAHLLEAYRFVTSLGSDTYYMGARLQSLPWHYVFVWIGITTPLLYTGLFLTGLGTIVVAAVRSPVEWMLRRTDHLLPLLWFFLPVASVFLSGAGIFDGWRHLYFIYPAFVIVALYGLRFLYSLTRLLDRPLRGSAGLAPPSPAAAGEGPHAQRTSTVQKLLHSLLGIHSLWIAGWIILNHPVQNVYFSLPAAVAQHNFELDYWGLSFRPALEWLLAHETGSTIPVWATASPAYYTIGILPAEAQKRFTYPEEANATYVLNNYRRFGYDMNYPHKEIHAIYSGGVKVLGIYKMRE